MSNFLSKKCVPFKTFGGNGGDSFSHYKDDGSMISRVEAYFDDFYMKGIKVYYSNSKYGYSKNDMGYLYGKEEGQKFEYTFAPGETFMDFSIYSVEYKGKYYVGGFKFSTSKGNTFYPKSAVAFYRESKMDVGFGAAVGFGGHYDSDAVYNFGFYFIRQAKKIRLYDVAYDKVKFSKPVKNSIVSVPYMNKTDEEEMHEYQYSYNSFVESLWKPNSYFDYSYSLTVSADVPYLTAYNDKESPYASWTYHRETSNSSAYSSSHKISDKYSFVVPPYTKMNFEMIYFSGHFEVPFYGRVSLTLDNNEMFDYFVSGNYVGGNTTHALVAMTSTPIDSNGTPIGDSEVVYDFVNMYERMAA